jgi:hypothetical protein
MGGHGSGLYFRSKPPKRTVEQTIRLDVADLRLRHGGYCWQFEDGREFTVYYRTAAEQVVQLEYESAGCGPLQLPIRLGKTATAFRGQRTWLLCPLSVNGVACGRRVRTVYLPRNARYFGCRTCHGLTYRSCQNSHADERKYRIPPTPEEMAEFEAMLRRWGIGSSKDE